MVRLYLKNYNDAECVALYNALHMTLHGLVAGSESRKDIESALDYLTGYMDAMHEKQKGGAAQCPRS